MRLYTLEGDITNTIFNLCEVESIYTARVRKQDLEGHPIANSFCYCIIINFKSGNYVRIGFKDQETRNMQFKNCMQIWNDYINKKGKWLWKH